MAWDIHNNVTAGLNRLTPAPFYILEYPTAMHKQAKPAQIRSHSKDHNLSQK
jgi:hypothetical protein